jgi:hypothetical protein
MPLKKLFSFDSDEVRRPRPQARYLEGRGSYPEMREPYDEFVQGDYIHQDELVRYAGSPEESPEQNHEEISYARPEDISYANPAEIGYTTPDEISYPRHTGRAGRRRLPLTTLEALVQIKANGLAQYPA